MNFTSKVFNIFKRSKHSTLANPANWLKDAFDWNETAAGVHISSNNAMRISTVWSAVRLLAETIGSIPLNLYRRMDDDSRQIMKDHPVHHLINQRPNQHQTASQFWEFMIGSVCLRGNAFAKITMNNDETRELNPLLAERMTINEPDDISGLPTYIYHEPNGPKKIFLFDEIFHLEIFGGLNPIQNNRQALGRVLATERYGSLWFKNNVKPGGVFIHPNKLNAQAQIHLKESLHEHYSGKNAHKPLILEQGLTWQATSITNEDAQFLETMKYGISDVARIFRIPPHMLGDLERATFNNIEELGLEFVTYTLRPYLIQICQTISRDLLLDEEKADYYAEHNVNSLLRGDFKARMNAYATGRQWGWLSVNDIRSMENMNPIENGNVYLSPMNMTPADLLGQPVKEK